MTAAPIPARGPQRRLTFTALDMALFAVVLFWGFSYVTYKIGQQEIPTGLFNLVRYVIAVPILWVALLSSKEDWRMPHKDLPRTIVTGLVGVAVYSLLFSNAAKMTAAANVSLVMALSPIWGVIIQWWGGGGAPGLRFLAGSAVAFSGAALVIAFGSGTGLHFSLDSLTGDLVAIVASVIWAWYGVSAHPLLKSHSGVKVQAWINLVALVGFLVVQGPAAVRFDWASVSPIAWLSLLFVATIVTVVSHIIWYTAIARVGSSRVMLAMYLIPVVAAVSGAVFLGQPLGLIQVGGASVALAGVAMVRRSA